jgi:hypothetical protein
MKRWPSHVAREICFLFFMLHFRSIFAICLELLPGAAPAKVANSSQISLWRSGETPKGLQPKKAAVSMFKQFSHGEQAIGYRAQCFAAFTYRT